MHLFQAALVSLGTLYVTNNKITELSNDGFLAVCFMYLQNNKIRSINPNFVRNNQCIYQPGVNATLHINLEGLYICLLLGRYFCKYLWPKNIYTSLIVILHIWNSLRREQDTVVYS